MKKLTKLLARFTLFSAAECAILFGLPALATRHPFILLAASLAEFAKLAESGTITRSQFETFAYHAVNSPLPNENFTDLNALADTLRKALDEGTQIIL